MKQYLVLLLLCATAIMPLAAKKSVRKMKLPRCPSANACNLCCKKGQVYSFDTAELTPRDGHCTFER